MEQQCRVAEVSRAGFYRYLQQTEPEQADLLLRARLQELEVEHHRLRGYRLLTKTLQREGQVVNHKRVVRLMREDNLLSLRRKKHVFTTDSAHTLPIYPNLARHTTLTALNQLWKCRWTDGMFTAACYVSSVGILPSGVDPSVETRKAGTDFVSPLSCVKQQVCAKSLVCPAKRTRALLESNPRRNNRPKTHRNDGRRVAEGGRTTSLASFWFIGLIDLPMP